MLHAVLHLRVVSEMKSQGAGDVSSSSFSYASVLHGTSLFRRLGHRAPERLTFVACFLCASDVVNSHVKGQSRLAPITAG